MGAPVLNGPFTMPMFRDFVPRKLQPWIYVFMAVTFQLSGGLYLGSLNQMIGSTSLMREDLQMCLYANLSGMAIYFPAAVPHEVLLHQQDLAHSGLCRSVGVQLACSVHHLPASAVGGVFHRGHVQDTRHL